jgi:hypothetical protein
MTQIDIKSALQVVAPAIEAMDEKTVKAVLLSTYALSLAATNEQNQKLKQHLLGGDNGF